MIADQSKAADPAAEGPPAGRRVATGYGTAILLASVATLLLPATAGVGALVLLTALWWLSRPRPGRWSAGIGLTLAIACLTAALVIERWPEPTLAAGVPQLEEAYGELWRELEMLAEESAEPFADPERWQNPPFDTFQLFEQQLAERAEEGATLLLLDPDGEAVAWAGAGLLHEPNAYDWPSSGLAFEPGHTAVTLLAVVPLSSSRRPWKVVAGRSLATDRLPFSTAGTSWPEETRWSLAPADMPPSGGATRRLPSAPSGVPAMFLEPGDLPPSQWEKTTRRVRRAGWILLGFAVFAFPILRIVDHRRGKPFLPAFPFLIMAGFAAWSAAATLAPPIQAALVLSSGLATWALFRPRRSSLREGGGELPGALAMVVLAVAAWWFQDRFGRVDLAAELGGSGADFALRFSWCFLALGLLRLAAGRLGPAASDRPAWLAILLLAAAAAGHDTPLLALPILALAGAAAGRWLCGVDFRERPTAVSGFLLLAALAGSIGWEVAYREHLRRDVGELRARLAPPTVDELNDLHVELYRFFDEKDLAPELRPAQGGARDLAYYLWRVSPISQRDGLSALVVEPFDGVRSSFSFGLALDEELVPAPDPARWQVPPVKAWRDAMIFGEADLQADGRPWGRARFWFLPRPGFRLEVSELAELDAALVRGEPHRQVVDGLPSEVLYALHSPSGEAIVSPWQEAPPLAPALLESLLAGREKVPARMPTPTGQAWYWGSDESDGIEMLYLPVLRPLEALERVGAHALNSLALIALAVALALLFALPRRTLRDLLGRIVRSYSKRLILVYTVLLLLPLIALNLFLLRDFESSLAREQLADARGAISSARLFIVDYLLRLEPGSSIETRLNRRLLEWVGSVVEHQVNLYWGSELYASGQEELFTAGLLTERVPGEIYSRLSFAGQKMGFRERRRGEVEYLEFYAPLPIPGAVASEPSFVLSVPLLEQEEATKRDLAAMRRRAVLVTTALFLLVIAVGGRLARSFTTPIMELIEGTRRIAAGAPFLQVAPREQELSALGDAIDDMAHRIAEGRKKLVLEKQVVERIVANITSGVVSLDHEQRVMLHNRVAAELLGTEVGLRLDETMAGSERLREVSEFLRRAGDEPRQQTLKLGRVDGESREWTLIWVPLPGSEDPAALLVVDDVTEVVRGQRLEAWAEMARIIAHEIKNPLTPIQLSAEHMRQVFATDRENFEPVLERCTDNIVDQVEELRDIASDFSIYSRIPEARLVPGDLVIAMEELAGAYRDAGGRGVDLVCDVEELPGTFDKKLLGRAMRNVLENALRASAGEGPVEMSLERNDDSALIRVADSGPGVDPAILRRIFEPYFSTYESGTGLGLAITRRIVDEHGGRIEARNRPGGGLEVLTSLPLAPGLADREESDVEE